MDFSMTLLREFPLFRDLNDEEIARIWDLTIQRSYPKRTMIFTEGAEKEAVYWIREGMVKAYKTDENGHEHIVSLLKKGDMFPHTGFFTLSPYPATAEAIMNTQVVAIPVRQFEQLISATPSIAAKVMRVMSDKISELQQKLQELTGQDVNDRGNMYLMRLTEQYGVPHGAAIRIEAPITHQDLASAIGTTRESVTRMLNHLKKEGIIKLQRNEIIVTDVERLRLLAAH